MFQTPTPEAIRYKFPLLAVFVISGATLNFEWKNVFDIVFYTFLSPPIVRIPSVCRGLFVLVFLQMVTNELYKI